MSRAIVAALVLGSCLSLFTTFASGSLSLSLSVAPDNNGLCGAQQGYRWSFTETVSAGDTGAMFFTIYDTGSPCTLEASFPAWDAHTHLVGTTPAGVSVTDDPSILNIEFDCGSTSGNCHGFGSSDSAVNDAIFTFATGCFAYAWQDYDAAGVPHSGTGTICAPGTPTAPEPGILVLLGLGLAGLGVARVLHGHRRIHARAASARRHACLTN